MEIESTDPQVSQHTVTEDQAEFCVRKLIEFVGEDVRGEHTIDTPRRVVKSFGELFAGYKMSPEKALGTVFDSNGYDQMVILKDIELYSTCAHHMIPFIGRAHIGYVPGKKVVGLSKLARLVEVYARRLQIQEQLTQQIADSMMKILEPKGVMVVIESKHLCMCARGIGKQHSSMVTSAIHGVFEKSEVRSEFLNLMARSV